MAAASHVGDALRRAQSRRAEIASMTTYALDPNVRTTIAVTPVALETFAGVRIDEYRDDATIDAALAAIAASRPAESEAPLDARYGVIFKASDGERILRAYKGRFASAGQIDDRPVTFVETAFHQWLTSR